MPHPYSTFENTPLWRALEQAISDLEANGDIQLATATEYVVGDLCRAVVHAAELPPTAAELRHVMSAISEAAYSAGWMQNLEYDLWAALEGTATTYGRVPLDQLTILRLRELSDQCGGWIISDQVAGTEIFVSLVEWRQRYAATRQ